MIYERDSTIVHHTSLRLVCVSYYQATYPVFTVEKETQHVKNLQHHSTQIDRN